MTRNAMNRARTKIIATVGPASSSPESLRKLVESGVDIFRLNMAHGKLDEHERVLREIRAISQARENPVAVLVDLAGPKIRLGELLGGQRECKIGEMVRFVPGTAATKPDELVCNYEKLLAELSVGNRIMLADGTVRLEVTRVAQGEVECIVQQGGLLRSRQGVNLPGAKLSLPALSNKDREHALWGAKVGADFISLSFVRSPDDVHDLKAILRGANAKARIIAKIEKPEALREIESIIHAADGAMVARGDLGVEIDVAEMPIAQKRIVDVCRGFQKPVIIATQMLDSMQHSSYPTRAEVTDVANAILDGCDACMLSGETAIGEYPCEAVQMMNRIAISTEQSFSNRPPSGEVPYVLPHDLEPVTQAVVIGAEHIATRLDAKLIVAASHSGATALALSKQRSFTPKLGVSDNEETLRQMALYWGVIPLSGAPLTDQTSLLEYVEAWGKRDGCLKDHDRVVLVSGIALGARGHNMVMVHEVGGRR